ncbi:MAG: ferric aerobactin receptor [Bacteroidetes bacterium GWE2_29_8]|nr:MAG: ferric aerobactin receptor [Bacteroidetes bacterium GWE2_29_8]OFY16745.1 MAG: ferric aerobactin receptor [Bacteroidetes bacterium GWF2_29_10]
MKTKYIILLLLLISTFVYSQNGVIRGVIVNKINNEPIPFVNVSLSGSNVFSTTDLEGKYEFANLRPGFYNVTASIIGYNKESFFEIQVNNSRATIIDFKLEENIKELGGITVKSSPYIKREEAPISLRTIGVTEINRSPGGNNDISKVIQSLPGVSPTVSFRNDIIIRGGSPNENRFYLDGLEIPNINHFATQGASGGPVGMINTDFIRSVEFYASSFPSNRNNALSSIMDFKFKDGRDDRLGGKLTIGASDLGLSIEGPLSKKSTFIASARRSYLQFLFKQIGLPFLPTYNDFQYKLKYKANNKNEFTFIGLGAIDDFKLNLSANETEQQRYTLGYLPVFSQWNYMVGGKYVHYNKNSYSSIIISRNMLNNKSIKYKDNIESNGKILDYLSQESENKIRVEQTYRVNKYKINYGFNIENARYFNETYNKIASLGGINEIMFNSELYIFKYGVFGQISSSYFKDRLSMSFGIRTDASDYNDQMNNLKDQVSPRFSFSYSLFKNLAFNTNVGSYFQLPAYTIMGYRDNSGILLNRDRGLQYIRSNHFVSGFEYISNNNLKLNLEGFYKRFNNYPYSIKNEISLANLGSNFGVVGNEAVLSISTGRSYGIEFLVQQSLFKGFYGLLTYTYVRSEFKDVNTKRYVASSWDNKHILNVTLGKTFKNNLQVGAKWRYAGGTPYTPYNIDASLLRDNWDITKQGIIDYSKVNTERLSAFHNLDIRIDKKYYYKKWSFDFYIDIQNVYNFKAEQPPIIDVKKDDKDNPIISGTDNRYYVPNYIDDFTGTILPTIGIIVEF